MRRDNPYGERQQDYISADAQPYQNLKGSQGPLDHLADGLAGQARAAFIAKVYALLSLELVITFSFCLVAQYSENYRNFQLDNPWVIIMAFVFLIATMIVAFCAKKARTFPLDMVLLLVFILSFSYIISLACSAVVDSTEDNTLVPVTIAATIGITAALTIYAFVCKGHYILWIGILLVCCAAAFTLGIASIFVYMPLLYVLICVLGLVIYGIYLVIITKMIIGNELGGFPLDSPIIASVFLYIYIMRIFIYLLALFSKK